MSAKIKAFMNLYQRGMISDDALAQAVKDGTITEEERLLIVGN